MNLARSEPARNEPSPRQAGLRCIGWTVLAPLSEIHDLVSKLGYSKYPKHPSAKDPQAGGCDQIANVICEATNEKVVMLYEESIAKGDEDARVALACLMEKCGPNIG